VKFKLSVCHKAQESSNVEQINKVRKRSKSCKCQTIVRILIWRPLSVSMVLLCMAEFYDIVKECTLQFNALEQCKHANVIKTYVSCEGCFVLSASAMSLCMYVCQCLSLSVECLLVVNANCRQPTTGQLKWIMHVWLAIVVRTYVHWEKYARTYEINQSTLADLIMYTAWFYKHICSDECSL